MLQESMLKLSSDDYIEMFIDHNIIFMANDAFSAVIYIAQTQTR